MKYPHNVQYDKNDCGVSCIVTILSCFGINKSRKSIYPHINLTEKGILIRELYDFFVFLNLFPSIKKVNQKKFEGKHITSKLKGPFLGVMLTNQQYSHYIVIHKINKMYSVISDPEELKSRRISNVSLFNQLRYVISFSPNEEITNIEDDKKNRVELLKSKEFIRLLFLKKKKEIVSIIAKTIFVSILTILLSVYTGVLINNVFQKPNNIAWIIAVPFLLIGVTSNIISYVKNNALIDLNDKSGKKFLVYYLEKFFKLNYDSFFSKESGYYISRFEDIIGIFENILNLVVDTSINFIFCLLSLVALFIISPQLGLVNLFVSAVIYFVVSYYFNVIVKLSQQNVGTKMEFQSKLVDAIEGFPSYKSTGEEKYILKNINKKIETFVFSSIKFKKKLNYSTIQVGTIQIVSSLLLITLSIIQYRNFQMPIGNIVMLTSLISSYLNSLTSVSLAQLQFKTIYAQYIRILGFFDTSFFEEQSNGIVLSSIDNISLQKFNIRKGNKNILENVDLNIPMNSNILLSGDNGTGKSSFLKVLVKMDTSYSGEIFINNVNLRDISTKWLRSKLIYISGNERLIDGSLQENLSFGKDFRKYELMEIIHEFGLDELVDKNNLKSNGSNISNGQKQKIILARAILRSPMFLIADEGFSNIDRKSIKKILEYVKMKGVNLIIVDHKIDKNDFGEMRILNKNLYILEKEKFDESKQANNPTT